MKIALLLIGLLLCSVSFAQDRPKQVDSLVTNLRKRGIDTILIYMQAAVWPLQEERDNSAPSKNCHCSFGHSVYAVNVIYKHNGKIYKLNYACCQEADTSRIGKTLSIPYFISQKRILIDDEKAFYKNLRKTKKFPPLIPTDYPWENIEFIVGKKSYDFTFDSYKSTDGYKIWKQYPWIDKQIKLIKLIRRDLMLKPE